MNIEAKQIKRSVDTLAADPLAVGDHVWAPMPGDHAVAFEKLGKVLEELPPKKLTAEEKATKKTLEATTQDIAFAPYMTDIVQARKVHKRKKEGRIADGIAYARSILN